VINIQLAGSNQNHKTSAYMIEDQTQYHRTLIQHHAILHQKDAGMQHPFQLCQQRNLFSFFCTCEYVARNDSDSKKRKLYLHLLA
jgi:hypothetical protein